MPGGDARRWRPSNELLEPRPDRRTPFLLRSHRPGDIGWVVSRQGAIYAEEYGWDISFEALVAEIGAQFIKTYDPLASIAGSRRWTASRSARSSW